MQQKGIVLLITLLFIGVISLLMVKNIDDSQKIITYGNTNTNLVQFQNGIRNINGELKNFFSGKNIDDLPEILFEQEIPLSFGRANVLVGFERFYGDGYFFDTNLTQRLKNDRFYITNEYKLNQLIKQYTKEDREIINQKQIDYIIDEYLAFNEDEILVGIKDLFLNPKLKDINCTQSCIDVKYSLQLDTLSANVRLIFNPSNTQQQFKEVVIKKEE